MNKGIASGDISPLKVTRRAPGVSHLLFADDTLLFFQANAQQAHYVKKVLEVYSQATGQLLNFSKCSIMFGSSYLESVMQEVKSVLGVSTSGFEEKYLGLPTPEGRMSKGKFQNL